MKLKYDFEVVDMGEEKIAVPVGNGANNLRGVIKLNDEGYEIFKLLLDGKNESEIISAICNKYDNDVETIRGYVECFIKELVKMQIAE